jgi:hypothetical protein
VSNAGVNQAICNTNTTNLSAIPPGMGQNGQWTVVGGSGTFTNPTLNSTSVSNLIKGINTFQWTITNGTCSNFDQVTITNNTPDSAKVAADKSICTNITQISAVAVSNGTGIWSVSQGTGSFTNPNNNNTNVTNIGTGLNTYTWTVTKNGCSLSASQQISNNSVTATIPVDVMRVCRISHDTIITALPPTGTGAFGTWTKVSSGSATIENPSNFSTRIFGLANGEIRFRWTVQNATCTAYDDISVINDYYNASASPVGSPNICKNFTSIMGNPAPPTGTNIWSSNNPVITFSNPANVTSSVNNLPLGPSTIYWTLTNNGCQANTSFVITNYSLTTDAGDTIKQCGPSASLSAQPLLSGQSGIWTASNVSVIFGNSTSPTSLVNNAPLGTSILTWTITANGCTATDNVLMINNSFNVSAGNDKTICRNTSLLEGTAPVSGIGHWSVIEGTGILSNSLSKTTNVTNLSNGNNIFRWTVTRYGCTAIDEVTITNNLYIADILPVTDVCVDTVGIQAVALPSGSGAIGVWTVLLGGGIFDNNTANQTIARNLALGQNQFRWTVTKGTCTSFKNITVRNNRVAVSAGPDQSTCETSVSLFATPLNPTGTGLWTGPQGVIIGSPNNAYSIISNIPRGSNTFTWTVVDKGCTGSSSTVVTNNSFDTYAGQDQMVTINSTTMNASLPDVSATGSWMVLAGIGTFISNTNPTTIVNSLGFGVNRFRWTATWKSCTAFDDVDIIYNVAESEAGSDQATCSNTITLDATIPTFGTGTWTVIQGGGTFQNIHQAKTSVSNIPTGTNIYRWTVVAFGIEAFDEVSITNNSFHIYAGVDQATCNTFVDLNAESAGSGTGSWYILQGSGSFSDNYIPNPRVSNIFTGTNKYIWQVNRNGCYDTDTVLVVKYQTPTTANAGIDDVICNTTDYLLQSNTPTIGTGLWSADNAAITIDNPSYVKTDAHHLAYGPNSFWWTISTAQCQSSDQVIISSYNTLEITTQPIPQDFAEGSNLILTVETSGGTQSYQWQKDGINLIDDSRINGSNNNTLNISNLNMGDLGVYTCQIQGYCNALSTNETLIGVISGIEELSNKGIKIYPNPSSGIIHLDFYNNKRINNLNITDLNGKKIVDKPIVNQKETIDLSGFGDGVYLINFTLENELIKTKIIIQK